MTGLRPVGLVLVRPTQRLGAEPFYQELIAGIERVLLPRDVTLLLQIVTSRQEEIATYDRWAVEEAVSGILLVDLALGDERIGRMRDLGLCVVVVGDPLTAGGFPAVWTDDSSAIRHAVTTLVDLGHRTIGRVGGPASLAHSQIRSGAFQRISEELDVTAFEIDATYSEEAGRLATIDLLARTPRPTVIIYDDDLMALGALRAAEERHLRVPDDISLLAWDDSALCQLSTPSLSVMGHDVQAMGEIAARAILDAIEGGEAHDHEAPMATFVSRNSVSAQ